MNSFPDLGRDDIEVRLSSCNQRYMELLLYKDARVDMRMLDENVGPERWQRRHSSIDGVSYCEVGIEVGGEWVWKQDCGTAGSFEAEKSKASDAFKRACFNWGIGRELYTSPRIAFEWHLDDGTLLCNAYQDDKGRWKCWDDFKVSQILIEDKRIVALSIKNETTGKYVFRWDGRTKEASDVD